MYGYNLSQAMSNLYLYLSLKEHYKQINSVIGIVEILIPAAAVAPRTIFIIVKLDSIYSTTYDL